MAGVALNASTHPSSMPVDHACGDSIESHCCYLSAGGLKACKYVRACAHAHSAVGKARYYGTQSMQQYVDDTVTMHEQRNTTKQASVLHCKARQRARGQARDPAQRVWSTCHTTLVQVPSTTVAANHLLGAAQ
jgi:hypothetical protein